jgi:hypothetical protein
VLALVPFGSRSKQLLGFGNGNMAMGGRSGEVGGRYERGGRKGGR